MNIPLDQIKKLRAETKAGVMDTRQALKETGGNLAAAKKWLAKRGLDKAAKKAGRETSDGSVEAYIHNGSRVGAIVKLSCETDFVARTQEFKTLARELAMQAASMNPATVDELLTQDYIRDTSKKVGDLIKEAIAKLGENIEVAEFKVMRI